MDVELGEREIPVAHLAQNGAHRLDVLQTPEGLYRLASLPALPVLRMAHHSLAAKVQSSLAQASGFGKPAACAHGVLRNNSVLDFSLHATGNASACWTLLFNECTGTRPGAVRGWLFVLCGPKPGAAQGVTVVGVAVRWGC